MAKRGLLLIAGLAALFLFILESYQPHSAIGSLALDARCMTTIVQTTYRRYSYSPNLKFVVTSHQQSCQNLQNSYHEMLAAN